MPEQIRELRGDNGPMLVIRGEDPAEIHRLAMEWATEDGSEVSEDLEDVQVISIRAINWCWSWICDCGQPGRHYIQARPGSRGSFRGAFVELHYPAPQEVSLHG